MPRKIHRASRKTELNMTRIAVVGSGYWGKNLVRNFHALGTLAGICDKDPRILQNLQDLYDRVVTLLHFNAWEPQYIERVDVRLPGADSI